MGLLENNEDVAVQALMEDFPEKREANKFSQRKKQRRRKKHRVAIESVADLSDQ